MLSKVENIGIDKGSKSHFKAGVAGAGGGTIFVLIADSLPDTWAVKPILTYLAPTFSVISSAFWLWTLRLHHQYQRNRMLGLVLRQLEGYINNPMTTRNHKAELKRRMAEIQLSVLSRNMKEVEEMFEMNSPRSTVDGPRQSR